MTTPPISPATSERPEIIWDDDKLELLAKDEEEGMSKWVIGGVDIFGNEYLGESIYEVDELLEIDNIKLKIC